MDNLENFFIGAYATSPTLFKWDKNKEKEYLSSIKNNLNIRGLELPFLGKLHMEDEEFFLSLLEPKWEYVLTCLPGTMKALETNSHFGIASDNEQGGLEAIEFYKNANQVVKK